MRRRYTTIWPYISLLCAVFATVTDANATDVSGQEFMRGSKLGNIQKNTAHNNEMYGQMVVYLRLKGIVPPTAEK